MESVEFFFVLLLVGTLVLLLAPRFRKGGPRGERAQGTLLITGISPKPDEVGEQFVTISGVMTGPTVNEHHVYARMAIDVSQWPSMGDLIPVVYSPKNPDNWNFAPPEAPPMDAPPPPPPPYS